MRSLRSIILVLIGILLLQFTDFLYANAGGLYKQAKPDSSTWQDASFEILSPGYSPYQVDELGHPYPGREHCLVRVAPGIRGLTGIKIPEEKLEDPSPPTITLELEQPGKVLLALFQGDRKSTRLNSSHVSTS